MGDLRVKVDGLARLEVLCLAAQGKLEVTLHHQDELFALVFVGHRLVRLSGLDRDHKGPQVLVFRARGECLVGIVPGALDKCLCPLVPDHGLFLVAKEGAGIDLQGASKSEEKAY